ncbi:MAG TPA: tetratricopeptide repeat protein [Phycisphaerae bacterium]
MARARAKRGRQKRDPQLLREELLRPCRHLGYDRDQLGMYFLEREAFDLAESQFRRAAWLNPWEPAFRVHRAWALFRLQRAEEARELLAQVLIGDPAHRLASELWDRYCRGQPRPKAGGDPGQPPIPDDQTNRA